jgi:hypothetical protein
MAIKKRGNPKWEKGGKSPNPAGRPKDGESWAAIIAAVGNMAPEEIVEIVGKGNDLGRAYAQMPKGVQMKYLSTFRVFAALMFEPTHGLWKELMERAEGKVTDRLDLTSKGESLTPTIPDEERLAQMKQLAATIAEEVKKNA